MHSPALKSANAFNRELKAAGLYFSRLGLQSAQLMARLGEAPLPFAPEGAPGRRCNDCGKLLAPLILAGLAVLDRESAAYVPTAQGREWLRRFDAAGLQHFLA